MSKCFRAVECLYRWRFQRTWSPPALLLTDRTCRPSTLDHTYTLQADVGGSSKYRRPDFGKSLCQSPRRWCGVDCLIIPAGGGVGGAAPARISGIGWTFLTRSRRRSRDCHSLKNSLLTFTSRWIIKKGGHFSVTMTARTARCWWWWRRQNRSSESTRKRLVDDPPCSSYLCSANLSFQTLRTK